MTIPKQFDQAVTFSEQVLYVLSVIKKASATELAIELMELKGISSEDGVAELAILTEEELESLLHSGIVEIIREKREKNRYVIKDLSIG